MRFSGFSRKGHAFFKELGKRQDRDWFKAHKSDYETLWVEPMKALLEGLLPAIGKAYKGLPIKEPKIFRIQRDVRFAKDKSPYKTNIAAMVGLATGHWMLPGPDLEKFRKLILDEDDGEELAKRVKKLEAKGFGVASFEALK